MTVILIDSQKKEIKKMNIDRGLEHIYKAMGVKLIETGFYIGNDICYIDEEGAINGTVTSFIYDGTRYFGNGLIVGTEENGNDSDCELPIDQVIKLISFPVFKHRDWALTLFEEKGINLDTKLKNNKTIQSVLNFCAFVTNEEQDMVKHTLVKIDFANGDVLHFMNYLAKGIPNASL